MVNVKKGITSRSLTLCAIIFLITYVTFLFSFHPRVGGPSMYFTHYLVYLGWRWYFGWETILFPLMVIMSLLALASKRFMLTKQEWTIVYSVASIVIPSTFWWGIWAWCMNGLMGTEKWRALIDYLPPLWAPKDFKILAAYWESRNPYEWSIPYAEAWGTPIIMWVLFYIITNLWLYGLVLIFRRRMIEVEKLPYPVTTTTLTVIDMVTTPITGESRRVMLWSKGALPFWIGFLISIIFGIFSLPGWLQIFRTPPFTITTYTGGIWQGKFPPFQRSILAYSVDLPDIGLGFLFPLDILLTGVLFHWIFLVILPAVFVVMGVYPPSPTSEWGAMFGTIYFQGKKYAGIVNPGNYALMLNAMTFGVALYLIFYAREAWIDMFKKFIKGEAMPEEAASPRLIVTLFLASWIAFIIWMVISGIHILAALAVTIYALIVWFAVIRYSGEAWGPALIPWGFRLQGPDRYFSFAVTSALGLNKTITGYGMGYVLSNLTTYQPHSAVIPGIFSYKIASETKTDPREIFKIQIVTLILASILSVIIGWYTIGVQGLVNWRHGWTTSWDGALNNGFGTGKDVVTWTAIDPRDYGPVIVGTILGAVLMFLRTTFAWFIINPIAVPLLTILNFYGSLSFTIAFILKLLVMKIGGIRVYSKYGVPIAVGLFFGAFIWYHIFWPLLLMLRYGYRLLPI